LEGTEKIIHQRACYHAKIDNLVSLVEGDDILSVDEKKKLADHIVKWFEQNTFAFQIFYCE
jgi:hypothetical protein